MVRVLVVSANDLYGRGIAALVRTKPGFQVVGYEPDLDGAIDAIQQLRPEAIVLIQAPYPLSEAMEWAARALSAGADRVVWLNPNDHTLRIIEHEQRIARRVEDLFTAMSPGWQQCAQ